MRIAKIWVRDMTILTNPGPGAGVRPVTDWSSASEADVMGWFSQEQTAETDDGTRDVTVTQPVAWFPVGTAITAGDRVRLNDVSPAQTFQVAGDPNPAPTPRGPHHIEADLIRVVG